MSQTVQRNRLDRAVGPDDHTLGPDNAPITLVEYGSYACPSCRAANERVAEARDEFGQRLRYVFRHRPLRNNDLARRAAELVEMAPDDDSFWRAHVTLMTRSDVLTEQDIIAVAQDLGVDVSEPETLDPARARVEADERSAAASGVLITPTFFINRRRYDGAWDESSFSDAMRGTLGHRVRSAAVDFASWGPSAGILLLLATVLAIVLTNSVWATSFEAFWHQHLGFTLGPLSFDMSLRHWVNDGLLTVFFLVVGLEIKREFTVGQLSDVKAAALPIAAAIGGMAVPALLYMLVLPTGPWAHGWGIPMATDTAFAIALIVMMGSRVPVELRIFLTAAAIVDDIGAIIVVAIFYSSAIQWMYLLGAVGVLIALAALSYSRVYRLAPYLLLGIVLWAFVHAGGLHATLAGVLLALFIPTRPPANLNALTAQFSSIVAEEARHGSEVLHHGPSLPAIRAIDAIYDRIQSPADRLLRHAGAESSYIILPLFALANAGVPLSLGVIENHEPLMLAIIVGLVIGKPFGLLLASLLAVACKLAIKPAAYSWRQLAGAGAMAGIGFTMSLFIAGQSFPQASDFAAAKIAVFVASIASAVIGVALLWGARAPVVADQAERIDDENAAVSSASAA
ncbi:Na+/H+ antiporter NhaA [Hyphomicrobium sulfonivorans]|uniref:Na+/H+ antiporter NhaA n=1 Tax=Hyphomicrobium sulfonivorans TaxID=121290 RepID=UPI00156F0072|nr:Na+/H+ antiporter NhaA [Hyphomicrobium sulfonivorans]NSL73180.1 Na+/H+ antiporter NhaA [Hyphomicrobium sulfonivorans]